MGDNVSKMKYNAEEIKQLVADMSDVEASIVEHMRQFNVDVVSVTTDVVVRAGRRWAVPEYLVTNQGFTNPILDWSFVSFQPTRWGFAVVLDRQPGDDIIQLLSKGK